MPGRGGDEVVQRLVQAGHLCRIEACGHGLDALALTRQQQAGAIADEPFLAVGMAKDIGQLREVVLQTLLACHEIAIVHGSYIRSLAPIRLAQQPTTSGRWSEYAGWSGRAGTGTRPWACGVG